ARQIAAAGHGSASGPGRWRARDCARSAIVAATWAHARAHGRRLHRWPAYGYLRRRHGASPAADRSPRMVAGFRLAAAAVAPDAPRPRRACPPRAVPGALVPLAISRHRSHRHDGLGTRVTLVSALSS